MQVILSGASRQTVTVDYATSDGTATAGTNYTATSGTLTFGPGEVKKTVNVGIINDASDDSDTSDNGKTFGFRLSTPVHAILDGFGHSGATIIFDPTIYVQFFYGQDNR